MPYWLENMHLPIHSLNKTEYLLFSEEGVAEGCFDAPLIGACSLKMTIMFSK